MAFQKKVNNNTGCRLTVTMVFKEENMLTTKTYKIILIQPYRSLVLYYNFVKQLKCVHCQGMVSL